MLDFWKLRVCDWDPKVQFHQSETINSQNTWRLIGGPEESEALLKIRSQAWLYDTHLDDSVIKTPTLYGKTGFLYVFDGNAIINSNTPLEKGTSVVIRDEQLLIQSKGAADLVF